VLVGRGVVLKKRTVNEALGLDISYLSKRYCLDVPDSSVLRWNWGSEEVASLGMEICPPESIRLSYSVGHSGDERKHCNYGISLTKTPLNYGGHRWWFLCPLCWRRCRILYKPGGETMFACRLCHRMTYRSQQEPRNFFYWFRVYFQDSEKLLKRLSHTRSLKKQKGLLRRLDRITAGVGRLPKAYSQMRNEGRSR